MLLEYKSEDSNKFWESQLEGNALTVRFGKIGTRGQTHTKKFSSSAKAQAEYRKLACEKLAKGYKPTAKTVLELLGKATSVEKPKAIASLYIGEHVPDEVIADICGWATACIQHGMTPKQFKSVWNGFMEEDEDLEDALGRTAIKRERDPKVWGKSYPNMKISEIYYWLDVTEWGEGDLYELYAEAVKNGGDRFIWFDNNAYIDIVALRGDPGARAIEVCVLQEENCKNDKGQWLNEWPAELGPGAPIASMLCEEATLRDGRRYSATNL